MTFAITRVRAYGVEAEEAVNKRYMQRIALTITGLNTDTALDLGNLAGTFWTAAGGSTVGAVAFNAWKDINRRALSCIGVGGSQLVGNKQRQTAGLVAYDSSASAGGAATEALTVTGLAVADVILAVSQLVKGANSTGLNAWTDAGRTLNTLTVSWTGNPGAGSIVRVLVRKADVSQAPVAAGQYSLTMDATNTHLPNIAFATADAPTAYLVIIDWMLKDAEEPVEAFAS